VQGHVKDLCAAKARSRHKVGEQGSLASRETEAVEIDLGMNTALSKGPLADRHGPSQGEARFSKNCLAGKTGHVDEVRIVCSK
jgi:hypothetical protein